MARLKQVCRVFAVVAFLVLALNAFAQPSTAIYPSLESRLCQADWVFTGTIEQIEASPDKRQYAGYPMRNLTVHIEKTLKGKPWRTVIVHEEEFGRQVTNLQPQWEYWVKNHTQLLFFAGADVWNIGGLPPQLDASSGSASPPIRWAVIQIGEGPVPNKYMAGFDFLPIFSMDLSLLRTSGEVLSRAKAFLRSTPKEARIGILSLQAAFINQADMGRAGRFNDLEIPVVPQLEEFARKLIQHPDKVMAARRIPTDQRKAYDRDLTRADLRWEGVLMLGYFKSDRTLALLKTLLQAPEPSEKPPVSKEDFEKVRSAAEFMLTNWSGKAQ